MASLGMALALGACSSSTSIGGPSPIADRPSASQRVTDANAGWHGGRGAEGRASSGTRGGSDAHGDLTTRIAALPTSTLTTEEVDGLLWMREEEKLAHDVYVTLGDLWQVRVFENIARAETTHTEAVRALLDRYAIEDPAAGNPVGVFSDPDIQALYDGLVAKGSSSLVDALSVGALIEDLDISDLQERTTETPDIALVYDELERGSRNHLRAFVRNLDRRGAAYTPVYISQEAFDSIVGSPTEPGSAG